MRKIGDAKKRPLKIVMAGGGTGGHLFPALALAAEFKRMDTGIAITFAGAKGGLEEKIVPGMGYPLRLLDVEGIKRKSGLIKVRALAKAARSSIEAIGMLREIRPDGVIGCGSYSSAPVVAAARLLGIKTAILEQNALPGLTNKLLGKTVNRIYISFEEARSHFPGGRAILTGNPVRRDILEGDPGLKHTGAGFEGRKEKFTVLVFGGSQGAIAVNAAFLDATEYLTDLWNGLRVIHQTGAEGIENVKAAYRRKNLKAETHVFISDMAAAYAGADLVVCRAGATSIAEITALGLASVLIPYPFAADDHQTVNAECLASKGAAVMIAQDKLTGGSLATVIRKFYSSPKELKAMRVMSKAMGRPKAAEEIAENFLKLIAGRNGGRSSGLEH
ncbi:MAG: undecaprenyldiphospho-muramoylpentapeptide beta-N-acetylglucosaminyltransferase [Deltaproteobacteria bacterium]|nr:undecaprenyldiphospho-muramoylpentapeptide beta-N-acetylglucosaminyltransferase [Deltaproteobacteria bacterium]